LVQRW